MLANSRLNTVSWNWNTTAQSETGISASRFLRVANRNRGCNASLSASAAIARNGNICWHTHENSLYPPGTHEVVHPDGWMWVRTSASCRCEHDGYYWRGED